MEKKYFCYEASIFDNGQCLYKIRKEFATLKSLMANYDPQVLRAQLLDWAKKHFNVDYTDYHGGDGPEPYDNTLGIPGCDIADRICFGIYRNGYAQGVTRGNKPYMTVRALFVDGRKEIWYKNFVKQYSKTVVSSVTTFQKGYGKYLDGKTGDIRKNFEEPTYIDLEKRYWA